MFVSLARPVAVAVAIVVLIPAGSARAAPCWRPPVDAPIVDPFREPQCRWCPGNRGIEYGTRTGQSVTAVATGRVTFAGSIAGTSYVVVRHGSGRRVTYGNVRPRPYTIGDVVVRGTVVGRAAGAVHFGLRDGDRHVDPAPYLGRLVHRPRLVPLDGRRGSPAPPPRLRCDGPA